MGGAASLIWSRRVEGFYFDDDSEGVSTVIPKERVEHAAIGEVAKPCSARVIGMKHVCPENG